MYNGYICAHVVAQCVEKVNVILAKQILYDGSGTGVEKKKNNPMLYTCI